MKLRVGFYCAMLVASSNVNATAGKLNSNYLRHLINDIKATAGLPSGTAIAVVKDNELIYEGYFGDSNIEKKNPVTPDTRFYIASATKPLTALNFLLDKQQNPGLENVTVGEMFPDFNPVSRRNMTVANLLTHTASINNLPLVMATAYSGEHTPDSLEKIVTQLSTASSEPPGEFKYTNVGYNLYSLYSDKTFDAPWQQKLKTQVFNPAGMDSTTAVRSHVSPPDSIAKSYSVIREDNNSALYLEKTDSTLHAAGGVFTTARDMSRFLRAQINRGRIDGKQVFPADVIAESHKQQVTADTSYGDFNRDGYAWGWYTGEYKSKRMLHHFGGFAGVHAHLSFMPDEKIGLVVLNGEDFLSARLTGIVAHYVYGTLLGEQDIETSTSHKVDELKAKLLQLDKMLVRERQKINGRAWQLTLPEQDYVGDYTHPLLGTISITLNEAGRFNVAWGVMHSGSTGMNDKDKIRVTLDPTEGTVLTFSASEKVNSLRYGDAVFIKS